MVSLSVTANELIFVARGVVQAHTLVPKIGDESVETLYLNRVTSENKRIRTPPLSPPFKVGVFVVFYW